MLQPYQRCERQKPIFFNISGFFHKKSVFLFKNSTRKVAILLLPALLTNLVLNAFLPTSLIFATNFQHVSGNPTCQSLGFDTGKKIEKGDYNGTFSLGNGQTVTIVVTDTTEGGEQIALDWSATRGIDAVSVKAGSGANVYSYDSATSDTDLRTPDRKDISHLNFCWNHQPAGECVMELTKTDSEDPIGPGGAFSYSLVLKNTGTADCTGGGVKLKEYYDANTMFVSASPAPTQGNNLWNFNVMHPGDTRTVHIQVKASNTLQGGETLINKACFWTAEYDRWVCVEEPTRVSTLPPPPPSVCGNSIVEVAEDCDNGSANGQICSPDYALTCSYCSADCKNVTLNGPQCGDDIKNGPEECDGSDGVGANQECSDQCKLVDLPFCGDLVMNADEECDGTDGVGANQQCSAQCVLEDLPYCGDRIKNGAEQCDGSDGVGANQSCSDQCTLITNPFCGDGVKNGAEQCDDGNSSNGDGCSNLCATENICANVVMYGVQDKNLDDSVFFKLQISNGTKTDINTRNDYDIEAIDTHPQTGIIYGLSGDLGGSVSSKKLLVLDRNTGIPPLSTGVQLDLTTQQEYQGASFHPTTHELWAGGDNTNLRTVNLTTGASTVKKTVSGSIEALAWNQSGTELYMIKGNKLFRYLNSDQSLTEVCDPGKEIEGMEFDLQGRLVIGYHHNSNSMNVDIIDPSTCAALSSQTYNIQDFNDVETFTFECADAGPSCGNGVVEGNEACDNGSSNGNICSAAYGATCNYCSNACQIITLQGPACGDGVKNGTEACDGTDGVGANQQCSAQCTLVNLPFCGDNVKNGTEQCDGTDGTGAGQVCSQTCTLLNLPQCGDGNIDQGEQCDLGSSNGNICSAAYGATCNYCSNACQTITLTGPSCGDSVKNGSEQCDGTDGVGQNQSCSAQCTLDNIPFCGDNIKNGTEACDGTDGVGANQSCSAQCTLVSLPFCGDSIKNGNEQCDGTDGVGANQSCAATCELASLPFCGDGTVNQSSEQCDDANQNDGDSCNNSCRTNTPPPPPVCTANCGGGGGGGGGVIPRGPRLLMEKRANVFTVCAGEPVEYTVKITNIGNEVGKNLILTDTLPAGFVLDQTSDTTLTRNLGDIKSYETITVTYTATTQTSLPNGTHTNQAKAKIDNGGAPNNASSVSVGVNSTVCGSTSGSGPALQITKSNTPTIINPGGTVDYTITVKNAGSETAYAVSLNDVLPAGITALNGVVNWDLGDLAPGQTKTTTFKAVAASTIAAGTYTNIAKARASNHNEVAAESKVEVRIGEVLGVEFTELPKTGPGVAMAIYFIFNLLALGAGILLYRKAKFYGIYS